jgi:F420-dependent oxidoreductase-like protein
VKVGLQVYSFSWPGAPASIGPSLARIVRTADDAGFDSLWVMDHFWQIGSPDSELEPMLEGWTTLGFMAAHTERARLGLMVGGVHYRNPGLWVKAATTLDVLSGGRAWLGIGAGWNQAESEGLGFPFPSLRDRFGMLEETLEIAHGMWEGERGSEHAFAGRHFRATRLLNVPQSISRPRVPIMIGGGGEQRTLRLVARYADGSNLFGGPDQLRHKYAILADHCAEIERDFNEIERSTLQSLSFGSHNGFAGEPESADQLVERLGRLAEAGAQHVIVNFDRPDDPAVLEGFAARVLPQLKAIESVDPRLVATGGQADPAGIGPS